MNIARAKLVITGKVQGVFYRHSTRQKARELGLTGWVRNLADGSVEAEASGAKSVIEDLISWCRQGPANAQVENVAVEWQSDSTIGITGGDTSDFEIR